MSTPHCSQRHGLWLPAIVIGIISLQLVAGRMKPERQRPGAERNDLVLRQQDLPIATDGWRQSSFEAAKPADDLPEGQFWWTHAWTYEKSTHSSIVALDQLGLHEWHELTVCYQAKGWQIEARMIESDDRDGSPWDYVVAQMSHPAGEFALLIFSVFWGNGQPMNAPHDPGVINFTGRYEDRQMGIWSRMMNRVSERRISPNVQAGMENRGLQCQVFLVCAEPLDEEGISDAVQLHLTTRQRFRETWLRHAESRVAD